MRLTFPEEIRVVLIPTEAAVYPLMGAGLRNAAVRAGISLAFAELDSISPH